MKSSRLLRPQIRLPRACLSSRVGSHVGAPICTSRTLKRDARDPSFDEEVNTFFKDLDDIDFEDLDDVQALKAHTGQRPPKSPYPVPEEAKPFSEEASRLGRRFGFLFDCDGVLYQGGTKIQSAGPALRLCRSHDAGYLFLTNGGGNTDESQKAEQLHRKMGIPADEDLIRGRVIQSHTPLSKIFGYLKKQRKTIYTTSLDPDRARQIIKGYGFKNVVTAADLLEQYEHIFPFAPRQTGDAHAERLPGDVKLWHNSNPYDYEGAAAPAKDHLKIDHVFILNDPRDWALETQIIYDLLISHQGYYGTQSKRSGDTALENNGWQQDGQPKVWISNLDMFWKTEHPMNRFGTGAFLHALRGVWREATGQELLYKHMGKPSLKTYEYAHSALQEHTGPATAAGGEGSSGVHRVYMIGDNPESDVRGALEFKPVDGTQYVPILVRTGVWRETEVERTPRWEPAVIVYDVLDAVVWAMRQEGINIDRETAMEKLK